MASQSLNTTHPRLAGGPGYAPLTESTVREYLLGLSGFANLLGGPAESWTVREVGDGNLNLVFVIRGRDSAVVVKQALPYVRLVGEGWPLPLDRAFFEHEALRIHEKLIPERVPRLYHFDKVRAAMVMEFLEPHIVLRKGLIAGVIYPQLASHMAQFVASTLYSTSDFGSPAAVKRDRQALFSRNAELCRITEELVFTDPYRVAPLNRWTSPQLDSIAEEFRADGPLKVAVQDLKRAFLSHAEALLHGDLHTGSVMVTQQDTKVIDPEFAFVGPIGFDLGAFIANLLLAYFAQPGLAKPDDDRLAYREWILETIERFWNGFESCFLQLWRAGGQGDAFTVALFADVHAGAALDEYRQTFLASVFVDAVGFAGAKMVRRILGLAHVEDLEGIADPDIRAACEIRILRIARTMILDRAQLKSVSDLTALARKFAGASASGATN
jgi:5-methylthioribose kinase